SYHRGSVSECSGSRASILGRVRPCASVLSLTRHHMLPRTTQSSYRPLIAASLRYNHGCHTIHAARVASGSDRTSDAVPEQGSSVSYPRLQPRACRSPTGLDVEHLSPI